MATEFSTKEWTSIRKELSANPEKYGLPRRVYGSFVLSTFNIRKLGQLRKPRASSGGRDEATMRFLADTCRHFDLLAVQEVMEDMDGIRCLKELMGPEYSLIVSDTCGVFPGELGNVERMAFIYNSKVVWRTELVTDVIYERTKLIRTIAEYNDDVHRAMDGLGKAYQKYNASLNDYEEGRRRTKPREPSFSKFEPDLPVFLSFIRSPFGVGFQVQGHPGTDRYEFLAINAHLHYGRKNIDPRLEAEALARWIVEKIRTSDISNSMNIVLLGDLNLNYNNPEEDQQRILDFYLKQLYGKNAALKDGQVVIVEGGKVTPIKNGVNASFPFLFPHPRPKQDVHPKNKVFRTNVRLTETFDQIGIFSRDERLTQALDIRNMGLDPRGPDYGVFNFADLFSQVLKGKPFLDLSSREQKAFVDRFQHTVSDHMPLWLRFPLPEGRVLSGED